MLFDSLDTVVRLMRRATTSSGLRTTVHVIRKAFETGRKLAADFKDTMAIKFSRILPKWNYSAIPQTSDNY